MYYSYGPTESVKIGPKKAGKRAIDMTKYNINLASEFYVLSMLHRLGRDTSLTLGNKKSVDIVVVKESGTVITIDVKGLAGKTSWPVDNVKQKGDDHFVVFVSFLDKIDDYGVLPEVYIVPSPSVAQLVFHAPIGRRVIQRSRLKKEGADFHNAWHLLQ